MRPGKHQFWQFVTITLFIAGLLVLSTYLTRLNFSTNFIIIASLFISLISIVVIRVTDYISMKSAKTDYTSASADKMAYYQKAGLSNRDIQFFRHEMAEALTKIEAIIEHMDLTNASQMLFERLQTKKILQSYFQQIVKYPQEISEAAEFLYRILPELQKQLSQYEALTQQAGKTSDDYLQLQAAREQLEALAIEVKENYHQFVDHTLQLPQVALYNKFSKKKNNSSSLQAGKEEIKNG